MLHKNKASCRVKPVASPREKNARPATKEDFKLLMARNPGLTLCSKFLKYSLYHPHKRLCDVIFFNHRAVLHDDVLKFKSKT